MSSIRVIPLGAGQDVGRSCILVTIGGKNVMLDCGMHMGYNDERRFPDFSYITENHSLTDYLDCVIISHFHLDHCGALPYMTEIVGYDGPIYMTHPTKAICPILLDDYRKITVERRGEQNFFTSEMIYRCMSKVKCVYVHQTVKVDDELELQAFYAGHVLGAAMFLIRVGSQSVLYTGDYNMTPDRHLGAAWVSRCCPDILITESTYATTIRDSKRAREREFLEKIHARVEAGGKVLIPVFALGRAQELCILLETYWERMNISVPIYFSMGMAEKANEYYKLFISWTNQKIKETFVKRNMFEFKHIKPLGQGIVDNPGPMVVFATPGMLHAGQSLHIFRKWAPDERNMVVIPGYCVAGTVGYKILNGVKRLEFDRQALDVNMRVEYLSFSAHADARGIMQLISHCQPRNVLLVHGEASKMDFLKAKIEQEFGLPCLKPANGEIVHVKTESQFVANAPTELLCTTDEQPFCKRSKVLKAGIIMEPGAFPTLLDRSSVLAAFGVTEHTMRFTSTYNFSSCRTVPSLLDDFLSVCSRTFPSPRIDQNRVIFNESVWLTLEDPLVNEHHRSSRGDGDHTHTKTARPKPKDLYLTVTYTLENESMGKKIIQLFKDQIDVG
ncbi:Integrator complex subunit 11 [Clonorchis sinensis]|uniref:Integrator complex subunit 11 n=1 Tax=Clonorchis sinensis TaxID=79923 RepID=A0A8T1M9D3_CLOSI|nr:Integrator complex subunit 11 [Clonorchis sinensis]